MNVVLQDRVQQLEQDNCRSSDEEKKGITQDTRQLSLKQEAVNEEEHRQKRERMRKVKSIHHYTPPDTKRATSVCL